MPPLKPILLSKLNLALPLLLVAMAAVLGSLVWLMRASSIEAYQAELVHEVDAVRSALEQRAVASTHHLEILAAWIADSGADARRMQPQFDNAHARHPELVSVTIADGAADVSPGAAAFERAGGRWLIRVALPIAGEAAPRRLSVTYDLERLLATALHDALQDHMRVELLAGDRALLATAGSPGPAQMEEGRPLRLFGSELLMRVVFTGPMTPSPAIAALVAIAVALVVLLGFGVHRLTRVVARQKQTERQMLKLLTAVEQSGSTIIITDVGGRIEYVNRRFCALTGYEQAEVIGRTPRLLKSGQTPPDTYRELWQRVLSGTEWRGEMQNRKKDGSLYWVSATITPVRGADGGITNMIGIGEDITDRKLAEQRLHQAQKMEAVGQLTGGVAHDFNNLLTVVLGNLELLEDRGDADPQLLRPIRAATRAARKGAELTQRLLAFSRKQALSPRIINLNRLVTNMTELLSRTLSEAIEIQTFTDPDLWTTVADPNQLENAILNLALNARDAMPGGGVLTLSTERLHLSEGYGLPIRDMEPGDYVLLAVTDTGVGIAPENLARVFEPFFTTKGVGKGSGLGLSMVYGFARQSGGGVKLYSEPGHGTTVKLFLPRADGVETAETPGQPPALAQYQGSGSILVVEDDEDVRQFAVGFLKGLGYRVHEAATARDAIDALRSSLPLDLVFSDVVLPGALSGQDIAREAHLQRPDVRVLLTSGYAEIAITHNGTVAPDTPLLHKPYSREELAWKVQQVLRA